ncbi:MAG: hypothetical protein HYV09_16935 [Deltaproteobacteria bacterium]|nr:hypothetical protein [Deltaproteobacteria bacterium]
MKILSPRVHGFIDYVAVVALAVAPSTFGLSGTPAALCYIFAILHLGLSIMTNYPMGVARVVPFTVHAGVELGAAVLFVVSPWLFRFSGDGVARNLLVAFGLLLAGVWAITDYKAAQIAAEKEAQSLRERTSEL